MRLVRLLGLLLAVSFGVAHADAPPDALTQKWFNGDVRVKVGNSHSSDTFWELPAHTKEDVAPVSRAIFGRALEGNEFAALTGAPDGSKVVVTVGKPDMLVVFVTNPKLGLTAERWLMRGEDGPRIYNQEIHLANDAPEGMGTRILAHQVAAARSIGIKGINLSAARSPTMNGYYTWPRLGFEGRVPSNAHPPESLGQPKLLSQVMATEHGRAWWKEHGETVPMEMKLAHDGSTPGEQRHSAYLASKGVSVPSEGLLAHDHSKSAWFTPVRAPKLVPAHR